MQTVDTPPLLSNQPLVGYDLLRKYEDLPVVVLEDGVYYHDIHEGSGASPEYGAAIFFLVKAYSAFGGEISLGDSNHVHPEGMSDQHAHPEASYSARWTFYGAGGGTFSLGSYELDHLFADVMAGMKETGSRIVYITSDRAYGTDGYEGHEFSVPPNTDLVLKISLLRVRKVELPEDLGFQ